MLFVQENSTILEVKEQGSISTAIYYHYVRAGAHLVFIIALCVGIFTGEVCRALIITVCCYDWYTVILHCLIEYK